MLIRRTENLVTPTPGVLAINNETRRRLACRCVQRGNSETVVLVFEFYGQCPHIVEPFFDWWTEGDAPVQLHEERIATVANRVGQPGAYCMVADIHALLNMAEHEGMVWVARDRELTSIFGARS
jgi:hypothetical protein